MLKATMVKCNGEAHSNAYIDNCGVCMPYWHHYPTCPKDGHKLLHSGFCRECKKYYAIEGR